MNKLKIHIYGLPHTITKRNDKQMITCAYTTKVWLICKMFMNAGHEVIHYGVETSDVPCTENIEYIPYEMWYRNYGKRDEKSHQEHGYGEVYDYASKLLPIEINSRVKDPTKEVILATFGDWSPNLKNINSAALIEYGVGYNEVFSTYRIFESYAHQHSVYSIINNTTNNINHHWFDAVVPGYIDSAEFEYNDNKENYLLFLGRIIQEKGLFEAIQLAQKYKIKLIVAGNGNKETIDYVKNIDPNLIEYVGVVDVEEKKLLMKYAKATLCMTHYVEPFGNVHMESLMSGTPVITTDWGVYTESVLHGEVGFRVRTFEDYCFAYENLDKIDSKKCRDWAMSNWSLDAVYPKFNAFFNKAAAHFNDNTWYFKQKNRLEYITNYQKNYNDYIKTHLVITYNDNSDKIIDYLKNYGLYNDNYDISIISNNEIKELKKIKNLIFISDINKLPLNDYKTINI